MSRRFRICMARGGGYRVSKFELRTDEVDPYFNREKNTLGGVLGGEVTILTLEQNPEKNFLERILL